MSERSYPLELLRTQSRLDVFRSLLTQIRGINEFKDQIALKYALIAAGLHHTARETIVRYQPLDDGAPLTRYEEFVPLLFMIARNSPFPGIRARAVNHLPLLDGFGEGLGSIESFDDLAVRLIYASKLGRRDHFETLAANLKKEAKRLNKRFFLMIPPMTASYVMDRSGPCLEQGPGGRDEGILVALTVDELYQLLRIPPELPSQAHVESFRKVTGDFLNRKPATDSVLIIVDLQKDFLPGGARPEDGADELVPIINRIARHFFYVVKTQQWYSPNQQHESATLENHPIVDIRTSSDNLASTTPQFIRDTPGAFIVPGLWLVGKNETLQKTDISKRGDFSLFNTTWLSEWLRLHGVKQAFVTGLTLESAVKQAAIDSVKSGFQTTLILDGCRSSSPQSDVAQRAISEMKAIGVRFMTSDEIVSS